MSLLLRSNYHPPRSSCWSWRVTVHDGELVRGVLVLLLVLGHHPPAAGTAELPRVVAAAGDVLLYVLGRATIKEVR